MSTALDEQDAVAMNRGRRSGGREARRAMRAAPLADDIRPVRAGLEGGRYKPLTQNELERIHEAVLTAGAKTSGCTVHFVDEQLDHGVIVLQRTVPVQETDDAHTLSARILAEEHIAYTEAIARVLSGDYVIEGRRYVRGR